MASNDKKNPVKGVDEGPQEVPDDIHAMLRDAEMIDNEEAGLNATDHYWVGESQELPQTPPNPAPKKMSAHAFKELKKTVAKQKESSPGVSSVLDRFKSLDRKKPEVDPNLVNDLKKTLSDKPTQNTKSDNTNATATTTTTTPTPIKELEQPDSRTALRQVAASNLEVLTKNGELSSYDDAVKALEEMGLNINRQNRTGGSISISHPELVDKNGKPIKARIKTSDLDEGVANIVFKESIEKKAKKLAKEEQRRAAVKFTEVDDTSLIRDNKKGVPNKPLDLTFPPPPDVHSSLTDKVKKSEKLSLSNNSSYAADHVNSSINLYRHPSTSGIANTAPKYAGAGVVADKGSTKSPKPAQPSQYKTTSLSEKIPPSTTDAENIKSKDKPANTEGKAPEGKKPDVAQKNKEHPNHPENSGKPNTGAVDESGYDKQNYPSDNSPTGGGGAGFTLGANIEGAANVTSRAVKSSAKVASKAYQGAKGVVDGVRQRNTGQQTQPKALFDSLDSSNPAHNLPNLTKQALNKAHNANLTSQQALLDIDKGGLTPAQKSEKMKKLNDGFRDYSSAGTEAARSLESNASIDNSTKKAGTELLENINKDVVDNSKKAKNKNLLDQDNKDNLSDRLKKIKEMIDRIMQIIQNVAHAAMAMAGRRP